MDQSISVYGKQCTAGLVNFKPELSVQDVKIPGSAVFVVANSMVVADKVASSDTCYNLRFVETRVAAAIMHARLGGQPDANNIVMYDIWKKLESDFVKCLELVDECFKGSKGQPFTMEQAASQLKMSVETLAATFARDLTRLPPGLDLYNRARHVFTEAKRVHEFAAICRNDCPAQDTLTCIGKVMDESQRSCRDYFHCSCPELDELVQVCKFVSYV